MRHVVSRKPVPPPVPVVEILLPEVASKESLVSDEGNNKGGLSPVGRRRTVFGGWWDLGLLERMGTVRSVRRGGR